MIRLLFAATMLALGFTSAMAADLPVKAPPIVAAEYNWSGIYGGINAGWIEDHYRWRYTNPAPATCCAPFSASQDNALIGGHIGAQYQFNHFVLGVEAAVFNGAQDGATGAACVAPNSPTIACQVRRGAIVTAGGRFGYGWNQWLVYGTGGGAWSSGVNANLFNPAAPFGPFNPFDFTSAGVYRGWYAGVGVEYVALRGQFVDVIVGAEYQHIDLGTRLHLSTLDGFSPCPPGVNCRNIGLTEDLVRARLSLKWNAWGAPVAVVAKN
jgi:outer membrane immunogenic protein